MSKVVDARNETQSKPDDDFECEVGELAFRSVLDRPVCNQVYKDCSVRAKYLQGANGMSEASQTPRERRTAPLAPTDGCPTSAKLDPRTNPNTPDARYRRTNLGVPIWRSICADETH